MHLSRARKGKVYIRYYLPWCLVQLENSLCTKLICALPTLLWEEAVHDVLLVDELQGVVTGCNQRLLSKVIGQGKHCCVTSGAGRV
eukprot:361911-Chlamydomonas_euryale.AAC.2